MASILAVPAMAPAIRRLSALTPLDDTATAALRAAAARGLGQKARRELLTEGQRLSEPVLLLEGWAARVRLLQDGRRQFIGFALPGDIIGLCGFDNAISASTAVSITRVETCPLPDAGLSPSLARAYAISRAVDEAHLMAQITRLGRLNARERIIDLLLELRHRLSLAALATAERFSLPLTQEMLADALGLTAVHVNRMLQQARRNGELEWTGHDVRIPDPNGLIRMAGWQPTVVT